MRILVFSDSHHSTRNLRSVLNMHGHHADCTVHLGDGAAEFLSLRPSYPSLAFYAVAGNCDLGVPELPQLRLLTLENTRLYLCHGHYLAVKASLDRLINNAVKHEADIALFGHTHTAYSSCISEGASERKLFLMNPGSISQPQDGCPSYGIIDIGEHGIHCHIARLAY